MAKVFWLLTDIVSVDLIGNRMEGKIQQTDHLYNGVVRFLAMLEEEVYSATSPIWDTDFMHNNTNLPLSPTIGMVQCPGLCPVGKPECPVTLLRGHDILSIYPVCPSHVCESVDLFSVVLKHVDHQKSLVILMYTISPFITSSPIIFRQKAQQSPKLCTEETCILKRWCSVTRETTILGPKKEEEEEI